MRGLSAIVVLLLTSLVMPARADDGALAAAEAAYSRGALREANRLFLASLRQAGHERDALVRIHLHLGILAGATGAERTARTHYAIALALDPTLSAPSELAGRDRSRFEQERPDHGLSVVVEREGTSELVVRVWHAPPRLVRRVVVRCGDRVIETAPIGRGSEISAVRASTGCDQHVAVQLEDEHGSVLLRHAQASAIDVSTEAAP
ncbi:MAG: hypothetical protein J0L92_17145 [Deltaproteobacteria bacterium]|nr:hypothetical protein [Deltaproteobacteria bacterium]